MSTLASDKAISRWEKCRLAAEKLGCGKTHVHDKLYGRLCREDLLHRVIEGNEQAIETVKAWDEYSQESMSQWQSSDTDVPKTAVEKIKVAMWFIRKMGGAEKAKKAIDATVALQSELT